MRRVTGTKPLQVHLDKLVSETTPPPRKLTAEACFILRLMVEACRRPLQVKEGEKRDELFALDLVPMVRIRCGPQACGIGLGYEAIEYG